MGKKISIDVYEYYNLLRDSAFLSCLLSAGVDNSESYNKALYLYRDNRDRLNYEEEILSTVLAHQPEEVQHE